MFDRFSRRLFSGLVALALVLPFATEAAQPFDHEAFRAAQIAGKPILVDVYASWCSTCQAQKPIIQSLERDVPGLTVFEVDFDRRKDVLRNFRVQYQSTLIVFKGATEVGRSTGETDAGRIHALVEKAF